MAVVSGQLKKTWVSSPWLSFQNDFQSLNIDFLNGCNISKKKKKLDTPQTGCAKVKVYVLIDFLEPIKGKHWQIGLILSLHYHDW